MKPGEELKDGPPIHGNTRLEVIWTAMPAILIMSVCVYAFIVLQANEQSVPGRRTSTSPRASSRSSSPIPMPNGKRSSPPSSTGEGRAGRLPPALAGRDPQLLRAAVRREDRCGSGDRDRASGHADADRHLSGRVHRAVRRRPLADAGSGQVCQPDGVLGMARLPADAIPSRRSACHRRLPQAPAFPAPRRRQSARGFNLRLIGAVVQDEELRMLPKPRIVHELKMFRDARRSTDAIPGQAPRPWLVPGGAVRRARVRASRSA